MTERATHDRPLSAQSLMMGGLVAAVVGGALLGVGFATDRPQALHSLLTAWAYGVSIAVGALIFNMICLAMNARWSVPIRRLGEHVTGTLPVFAAVFVVFLVFAGDLYEWVHVHELPANATAAQEHHAHLLEHKRPYLSMTFFTVRGVVYFAAWIALAELLRRWSLAMDRHASARSGDDDATVARMRAVGSVGLPIVGMTMTFAAFDWLMSLAPTWFSTAYGVYYFAGGFLGALCLLVVLLFACERAGLTAGATGGSHFHALGRLVFGFTVFWAYIAFFQAFIIWIANKPEEVTWYIPRIANGWGVLVVVLIVGHFAIPFFILLSRAIKFHGNALAAIAGWQLVMGFVDVHWLVMPELHPDGFSPHWLDLAALIAVLGAAVAFGAWRANGLPLLAHGDPRFAAGTRYRSP